MTFSPFFHCLHLKCIDLSFTERFSPFITFLSLFLSSLLCPPLFFPQYPCLMDLLSVRISTLRYWMHQSESYVSEMIAPYFSRNANLARSLCEPVVCTGGWQNGQLLGLFLSWVPFSNGKSKCFPCVPCMSPDWENYAKLSLFSRKGRSHSGRFMLFVPYPPALCLLWTLLWPNAASIICHRLLCTSYDYIFCGWPLKLLT